MEEASTSVARVTTTGFDEAVLKSPVPVLVHFYADFCIPCNSDAELMERFAREFAGTAKVVMVNLDEEPGLERRFGISGTPTLGFFRSGDLVDTVMGYVPPLIVREKLEALVGTKPAAGTGGTQEKEKSS
jgi:thioredoxin 1